MSPCDSCHAGCCRSFAIPLSGADIIRIENNLNLTFWDFACRWADPDGLIARNYAPHFFFEDEPQTPFVITLMHDESVYFPGTTRCRYLMEGQPDDEHPLGQARCGIYNSRPGACRVFPTKFNASGDLAVIHDVPRSTRGDEEPLYELCPREWQPSDLDPLQPLHDLITARYEMQFFHQIAAHWNRSPRPWPLFPEFVHMIFQHRVVRENPLDVADEKVPEEDEKVHQSPPPRPKLFRDSGSQREHARKEAVQNRHAPEEPARRAA